MTNPAVAVLQSALRARKLDRTLTDALPTLERADPSSLAPMDVASIDACLHGGLPRGQLSELSGPCSSGRTTLLLQFMAAATRRGEIAAYVDTFDRLDVASAAAAGVDLDRLLWIRGQSVIGDHKPRSHGGAEENNQESPCLRVSVVRDRALDRALKALNLVLQAGGFGIVAIDLADAPPRELRQIPFTTWPRVQRAIEGRDTACVLLTEEPLARSAGGLTLSLAGRSTWAGDSIRSRRLLGADVSVRVVSPRKRIDGNVVITTRCSH
ncbi:MAG TPA: hypothetical protein VFO58_04115 [Vicinamibacterales bacterium]|nr:hypothetical protein [Vicinamibacterales bacterium]